MMKKMYSVALLNLRWRTSNNYGSLLSLICLLTTSVDCQAVTPSPTSTTLQPLSFATNATRIVPMVVPTPASLPQFTCQTGPDTQAYDYFLIGTNQIYLDVSQSVNCSGVITRWFYCHHIIGFREATSSLRLCVWRRANHSEERGYEVVRCNQFSIVPGDGEDFRCQYHIPDKLIAVEEGDYIGFYVPDSGLLPVLSLPDHDVDNYQLIRHVHGFSSFIKDSELQYLSCWPDCGRALLRAEIDSDWDHPLVVASFPARPTPVATPPMPVATSTMMDEKPVTLQPESALIVPLTVSLLVAIGVTIVLVFTVVALVMYVYCKNRDFAKASRNNLGLNKLRDMEYNDMYSFQNANYVVVGNQRTVMHISGNPAYDLIHKNDSYENQTLSSELTTCSPQEDRRQLEHTYESISNYRVQDTN